MQRHLLLLILIACACLYGCIGAMPLRQRTVGQQGPITDVDLAFIKNGQTTRAEILQKLGATDVGLASDQVFFGRWRTSKWTAWAVAAGYGGATGTGGRIWHNANLLVNFDSAGRVENYEVFADNLLVEKLARVVRETKLNPDERMEVTIPCNQGCEVAADFILSRQSLEIAETTHIKGRKQFHYTVPAQQLTVIDLDRYQDQVGYLMITMHFSTDLREFQGPKGKHLHVQVTIPQLTKLLAYQSYIYAGHLP
jgi:hypothetical protein